MIKMVQWQQFAERVEDLFSYQSGLQKPRRDSEGQAAWQAIRTLTFHDKGPKKLG